jgi:hypothetical protein
LILMETKKKEKKVKAWPRDLKKFTKKI